MKKVLGLSIALLLLTGISGIGTWAYFNDIETSASNVLAAGTLDLKTNDADGVSQTLLASNMEPGESVGPETIILKNAGSVDGTSLDLSFSYSENDAGPNPTNRNADDTAATIEVITLKYNGTSLLGSVSDINTNGYRDIQDLKNTDLSGKSGIASQESKNFEIAIRARTSVSGDFQADGITITMIFILNQ